MLNRQTRMHELQYIL